MPSAADRIDFGPTPDAGALRSFGLALLVHAALIAALTWGVNWKRSDRSVAFEAELWSSMPQQAAPKLIEAPPPPTTTGPPPGPTPKPQAAPPPPPAPNVDIALEQEKKRKLVAQQKLEEKAKADAKAQAKEAREAKEEKEARLKAAEDAKKQDKKKQELKEQASVAQLEQQRKQNLARMMGQTGATGNEDARGTAQVSSGPSSSYGGKVRTKVKPNIVFTEDIAGNPTAEVEVRTALDGTIMSQRLVKSSGNKAWDDAVVKAIIRTQVMPRDIDGRVPTPMVLEFRPKD